MSLSTKLLCKVHHDEWTQLRPCIFHSGNGIRKEQTKTHLLSCNSPISTLMMLELEYPCTLLWRHKGCDGVSYHQRHNCLLNSFFRRRYLAFVWGINRWPVNSAHKRPVTHKMFPFDDVIIKNLANDALTPCTVGNIYVKFGRWWPDFFLCQIINGHGVSYAGLTDSSLLCWRIFNYLSTTCTISLLWTDMTIKCTSCS